MKKTLLNGYYFISSAHLFACFAHYPILPACEIQVRPLPDGLWRALRSF